MGLRNSMNHLPSFVGTYHLILTFLFPVVTFSIPCSRMSAETIRFRYSIIDLFEYVVPLMRSRWYVRPSSFMFISRLLPTLDCRTLQISLRLSFSKGKGKI